MAEKWDIQEVEVWDGNFASAQAMRQAQIDVVAAYPITPSTPIVEGYAKFLSDGYVDGEFIMVESEHAAMSGCIGAAAAGGRVATATSSQGLALMVEVLYQASGMRLPIVLNVVNRALASPLNVRGDHSDMYLGRDSGWLQLDAFNAQEAYDLTLIAFKIGEDESVRLPVMVHQDGFITSHTAQNIYPLTDDAAYKFVGDYLAIDEMLDFSKPVTYGAQTEEDWHYEHKAKQHKAILDSRPVIDKVFEEFKELTGREYKRVESYLMEDAEVAIIALGTTVETAKMVAEEIRKTEGIKAGVVSPRCFRPFPFDNVRDALKGTKAIACMDRSSPGGALGALYNEVASALYAEDTRPLITNYIYGLGGRDLTVEAIKDIYRELDANAKSGKRTGKIQQFISLRGPKLEYFE
ncbi:MAG TPA: 2-oxoacid:ferredoxin oxidoreductase subunit alpha [Campylobacterales bacterium]|nr:2-oxoacid:ferredoxin oxidoreductase subunit alpha [Campylobacterales bacterium]